MLNWLRKSNGADAKFPSTNDPQWDAKLLALKERLSTTLPDDALMTGLLGLIDANIRVELTPLTDAGLPDAEVHRLRGRIGMLRDLRNELDALWREAREKPKT